MVTQDNPTEAEYMAEFAKGVTDEEGLKIERTSYRTNHCSAPFTLEEFCISTAWLGKNCPVYPYGNSPDVEPCHFLSDAEHENYSCPILKMREIREVISKRGTPEQKRALERLADSWVRYASMNEKDVPFPGEEYERSFFIDHCNGWGVTEPGLIYEALDRYDKAKTLEGRQMCVDLKSGEKTLVWPGREDWEAIIEREKDV